MEVPLRPPPPGVSSNFSNPPFLGLSLLVAAGICLPLVLIFATIRTYARLIVLKKWKFHDYIFCLTCLTGLAFIAFAIPLTLSKPNGYHAWDIDEDTITKASMLYHQTFAIAFGPAFWLLKLTLFCFLLNSFKPIRWLRNSAFLGIIVTGLVFSAHTIIVAIACAPRPDSDVESYLNGLRRADCSSSTGIYAIASIITSIVNGLSDLYLVIVPIPLIPNLHVNKKQLRGIYSIHITGAIGCLCGLMAIVYRIKSLESSDFTGSQVPFNTVVIFEVALSLIIPCMPSIYTIWHHHTYIDINDSTTIGTPNMRLISSMSTVRPEITPPPASKPAWRKTHLSIEDLPYRKTSEEFARHHHNCSPEHDVRMKALPCTPLPLNIPPPPKTPKSPDSVRSMQLPIMLSASAYYNQ